MPLNRSGTTTRNPCAAYSSATRRVFGMRQPNASVPTTMTRDELGSPTTYALTPPIVASVPLGVPLCSEPVTHSGQDITGACYQDWRKGLDDSQVKCLASTEAKPALSRTQYRGRWGSKMEMKHYFQPSGDAEILRAQQRVESSLLMRPVTPSIAGPTNGLKQARTTSAERRAGP